VLPPDPLFEPPEGQQQPHGGLGFPGGPGTIGRPGVHQGVPARAEAATPIRVPTIANAKTARAAFRRLFMSSSIFHRGQNLSLNLIAQRVRNGDRDRIDTRRYEHSVIGSTVPQGRYQARSLPRQG
jgi:hypothetical protein